ncbi:hypothetical protein [Staphylococcus gallinarum]|uniref:hypothetical protein n=2 Tax=Staphylococcus gallinarum TaxID=1293 RepID=UPI000D1C5A8F|nr:hypothetical protein [Staphylococcus gallinarum]MCD8786694.1 hypothetical protein [Staphylococcus gallinarum]MCD8859261.1 hypothetical protein [Staphylococcus gallinarum]PTE37232.1 hypothetical protein BUZ00_03135 [Staphylococcus gallinarum]RIL23772.1 hypothetical protein BUY99_04210 [Staphylococcus gallinarum]RIL33036.1 hypothetical protein BUY98_08895 [Staphylococcus gallinarum]
MFWIIATILLGVIAILSLIYNTVKDTKIDALEYEVAYLTHIIFERQIPRRDLTDEEIRQIKDAWDKRIK